MPVQGSARLTCLTAYITRVTIRVGQMLGLHMVEDSQPTMVAELVADVTLVLALLVDDVGG
jgi:hypothetical protein